jgi:hypothetical protein
MGISYRRRGASTLAAAATLALALAPSAGANVPLTRVSSDPFTNASSQHATELEPDTYASGSTVVSAFQTGRFFNGGGTDVGWATSTDGGVSWATGQLPGMTSTSGAVGSPYERVSDASVAYDATHGTWIVSSIPLTSSLDVPTVFFSRSTDGLNWQPPVQMPPPAIAASKVNLDKNWTVCDNVSTAFAGHCYTELDNFGEGDLEYMSTSTDGGATWSVPIPTAGKDKGIGGQPVVQPNGTVVVPFEALNGKMSAFKSTDGGASWSRAVTITGIRSRGVPGLRTSPLPSAEISGDGTVYVAWQDCRFRKKCGGDDIVFSTSTDGTKWSQPARIPLDDITGAVNDVIPGLAVDKATSGSGTHLALTYYAATCGTTTCSLTANATTSPDGGAHWAAPTQLAGPMGLDQIADTSQGRMVGDYISTSFAGTTATTVIADGRGAHGSTVFDEALYAPTTPLTVASAAQATRASTTAGAQDVTGVGTGETHHALRDE